MIEPSTFERVFAAAAALEATFDPRAGRSAPGAHHARRLGPGAEFAEHKPYVAGDDLRHLDWRVYARSDRLAVRRHEGDRSVDLWIVLDSSGSMAVPEEGPGPGGVPESKWRAAVFAALVLARFALNHGDRVGLAVGGEDGQFAPRGGERWLWSLAEVLGNLAVGGPRAVQGVLDATARRAGSQVLVLIGDLLDEPEGTWGPTLSTHRARGGTAAVLHVVHPWESDLPPGDAFTLEDAESGERLDASRPRVSEAYRQAFAAFLERQRRTALDGGVRYGRFLVGDDVVPSLDTILRGGPR